MSLPAFNFQDRGVAFESSQARPNESTGQEKDAPTAIGRKLRQRNNQFPVLVNSRCRPILKTTSLPEQNRDTVRADSVLQDPDESGGRLTLSSRLLQMVLINSCLSGPAQLLGKTADSIDFSKRTT